MQSLTLHPDAWIREGSEFASGEVVGYRVGGMPDGTTATRLAEEWNGLRRTHCCCCSRLIAKQPTN